MRIVLCFCLLPLLAGAQIPSTGIFTMDMKLNEQKILLENLTYLTEFNASGYNNQPFFIDSDHMLLTSNWETESTDVLQLSLIDQTIQRITKTTPGEYSPTVYGNGKNFCVVRQTIADDETVDQVLWSYPLDQHDSGLALIENPNTIGYFAWLSANQIAMFLVGEPNRLVIYDTDTKNTRTLARNIGRCLKTDDHSNLYYTQSLGVQNQIKRYNLSLDLSETMINCLPEQLDFDVLPNGFIISSDGPVLMTYRPLIDTGWQVQKDLSSTGIEKISRISSSSTRIALVVQNP